MAQCQEKRILKVDDIFNSFNVAQAKFSPDDKWAVVVIERPRKDQLVYGINFINRFDIWLLNVQSNSFVKILDGKRDTCSYWNPVWSEDSNHFAFISTKGQDSIRPYLYNINNGKVIQIHANGINVTTRFYQNNESDNEPFAWLDNDNIVFNVLPNNASNSIFSMNYLSHKISQENWIETKFGIKSTASVIDTDSLNTFKQDLKTYLVKFNLISSSVSVLDTGFLQHVIPSPDRSKMLLVKRRGSKSLGEIELVKSPWNFNYELSLLDVANKKKFELPFFDYEPNMILNKTLFFWREDSKAIYIKEGNRKSISIYNIAKSNHYKVTSMHDYDLVQINKKPYLSKNNILYSFNTKTNEVVKATKVVPGEEKNELKLPNSTLLAKSKSEKYRLNIRSDSLGSHLELFEYDSAREIQTFNHWNKYIQDVKRQIIEFIDGYGESQKALLLHPINKTDKSKVIVACYPGQVINSLNHSGIYDTSPYADAFLNLILFASNGFYVLIPTMKTQGQDDYFEFQKSVLPAVNATQVVFDGEPVEFHLLGLSYGGYSVYSLLTQTTRFKSAIILAGFGDLPSAYGNFDMRYRYTENPFENIQRLRNLETGQGGLGTPYFRNPTKYIRNSPIFYSDKIKTPILIIHGDRDFVSIEQAEQMFTSLYRQGKKVRFLRFWGEGHNINSPKNIESMWTEIFNWLK
jgi:hypothetical protein